VDIIQILRDFEISEVEELLEQQRMEMYFIFVEVETEVLWELEDVFQIRTIPITQFFELNHKDMDNTRFNLLILISIKMVI